MDIFLLTCETVTTYIQLLKWLHLLFITRSLYCKEVDSSISSFVLLLHLSKETSCICNTVTGFVGCHCVCVCLTRGRSLLADQGAGEQIGEWLWWCSWTDRWSDGSSCTRGNIWHRNDRISSTASWREGPSVKRHSSLLRGHLISSQSKTTMFLNWFKPHLPTCGMLSRIIQIVPNSIWRLFWLSTKAVMCISMWCQWSELLPRDDLIICDFANWCDNPQSRHCICGWVILWHMSLWIILIS